MNEFKLKYDVDETPESKRTFFTLSIQHVFAMFGSTILVPTLIGMDVPIALVTAGIGTLIYMLCTKGKVPVFIGSSFAYIAICKMLMETSSTHAEFSFAVMCVGFIYCLFSIIISLVGTKWIDYILPPVVIGPLIMIIGLSLASSAVNNAGLNSLNTDTYSLASIIISISTILATILALLIGNKTLSIIPIIFGLVSGYVVSIIVDIFTSESIVDPSVIWSNGLFNMPDFQIPFLSYTPAPSLSILFTIIPLVLVTLSEHIGDHTVSSSILNRNFLHNPGLHKTILGDGLATLVAGILGGPVNTTYAENTGVIMLTRVASVSVIKMAAVFAILIAFINPIVMFISSIPTPVMGGISIILFGMIAQNGIRILIGAKIDIAHPRNLLLMSVILVCGLGGGSIAFNLFNLEFLFTGTSLAAVLGVILHLVLPKKEAAYGQNHKHIITNK